MLKILGENSVAVVLVINNDKKLQYAHRNSHT